MSGSVIVAGARTPMGRLLGSLKGFSGAQLGGVAIKAALERAGVAPEQVQYVIMGQVLHGRRRPDPGPAGRGGRRHPDGACRPLTINKVCLSGLDAIALADQLIRAGEFDIVVAGGLESMTQAPHLLGKSREGFKYGDVTMLDHMAHDGLFGAFDQVAMGASTEKHNGRYELTRAEQDAFAARSHQLAAAAAENGVFAEEIAPVAIPQRKGDPIEFSHRRGRPRRHHRREPRQAAPGVRRGRHHHRGLGLADLRRRRGRRRDEQGQGRGAGPDLAGRDRRARRRGRSRTPACTSSRPTRSRRRAPRRASSRPTSTWSRSTRRSPRSGIVSTRKLGIDPDKVNVNGGAIALGHPIGMSGARLALHLALELQRRGGGVGAAALCGGGGQGDALIIRVPAAG